MHDHVIPYCDVEDGGDVSALDVSIRLHGQDMECTAYSETSDSSNDGQQRKIVRKTNPSLTREFLQAAASVCLKHRSELVHRASQFDGVDGGDDRSSGSSLSSYPLRDRLRRLSRSQKKELLVRPALSPWDLPPPPPPPPPLPKGSNDDRSHRDSDSDSQDTGIAEPDFDLASCISKWRSPSRSTSSLDTAALSKRSHAMSVTEHPMVMTTHSTIVQDDGRNHLVRHGEGDEYSLPPPPGSTNEIKLHIYDLISKDTLMALPFGCICEIGKCFNDVNTALHELGTGAYHVGLEINGVEYAYGATSSPGRSGVFSCIPKLSPGYQYRTTIDFGKRLLIRKAWVLVTRSDEMRTPVTSFQQRLEYVDGRDIVKGMAHEYMGIDYDMPACALVSRSVRSQHGSGIWRSPGL
jgi:PPPDE putative peptidase domain